MASPVGTRVRTITAGTTRIFTHLCNHRRHNVSAPMAHPLKSARERLSTYGTKHSINEMRTLTRWHDTRIAQQRCVQELCYVICSHSCINSVYLWWERNAYEYVQTATLGQSAIHATYVNRNNCIRTLGKSRHTCIFNTGDMHITDDYRSNRMLSGSPFEVTLLGFSCRRRGYLPVTMHLHKDNNT